MAIGFLKCRKQGLGVQDTNDIVHFVFPHGNPRMDAIQHGIDDILDGQGGIEGFHLGAVDHDICHFQILEIKNAAQHVPVLFDERVFLVVQVNGTAQLVVGRQDTGIIVDIHAEQPQGVLDDVFHGEDDGTQNSCDETHDWRHRESHPVGVGNGVGFGHDFSKYQDDNSHDG